MSAELESVSADRLCIGLYVHLDSGWMSHPFLFNQFKIKNQAQLDTLRRLGIKNFRYDPSRSDAQPLSTPSTTASTPIANAEEDEQFALKRQRMAQLREIRNDISRTEHEFIRTADTVRNITRNLHSQPEQAYQDTTRLVDQMLADMLSKSDLLLHAMSSKLGNDIYFHSLNVTVLCMMLARAIELTPEESRDLGIAAMLHDAGKNEVPYSIRSKQEPLTAPERHLLEQHCMIGTTFARKMGASDTALTLILQHHEYLDGSGYPNKLSGDRISRPARALVIVNLYDNLCNPIHAANAMTPSEALSRMFSQHKAQLDPTILQTFIRMLGIYPPGSIVQLSNQMPGLVLSVNPASPLRPEILVYDPDVPRDQALIIKLENEPDLKIEKNMRPAKLAPEVRNYLSPNANITYFVGQDSQKSG